MAFAQQNTQSLGLIETPTQVEKGLSEKIIDTRLNSVSPFHLVLVHTSSSWMARQAREQQRYLGTETKEKEDFRSTIILIPRSRQDGTSNGAEDDNTKTRRCEQRYLTLYSHDDVAANDVVAEPASPRTDLFDSELILHLTFPCSLPHSIILPSGRGLSAPFFGPASSLSLYIYSLRTCKYTSM